LNYNGRGFHRICIESIGTGNTGVFILKAKTRLENTYHLLSDDEDESKITPSDEKLSIPINASSGSRDYSRVYYIIRSVFQIDITIDATASSTTSTSTVQGAPRSGN
jgi:hypothetical protein